MPAPTGGREKKPIRIHKDQTNGEAERKLLVTISRLKD